ncbi:MAG TPA: hypothetical protein ACFYEE_02895 [Candidatus Wujingus californicus]
MSSGLFTGLALAFVGYITSSSIERAKMNESHVQLYTELMGKREEAESALRKDMFTSIIGSFLSTEKSSNKQDLPTDATISDKQELAWLEEKVLNLELLAYNFHESLNLKSLFIHIKKIIMDSISKYDKNKSSDSPKIDERSNLIKRLNKMAKEITRKQMIVLEGAGDKFSVVISGDRLEREKDTYCKPLTGTLTVNSVGRIYRIVPLHADADNEEIKIRLEVLEKGAIEDTYVATDFHVGYFDFPMIDNTRLSHDQRCAIVLNDFTKSDMRVNITLLVFPGSHASLKEKPYYEEIINSLINTKKQSL